MSLLLPGPASGFAEQSEFERRRLRLSKDCIAILEERASDLIVVMARRREGESVQEQHPIAVRRRWRFLTCHNLIHSTVLYTLLLLAIAVVLGNYRLAPLGKK